MIELFTNDNYKHLKFMYENQTTILNNKVVPLTQQEMSSELGFSKMKTNSIFISLQKEGIIIQKTRSKYSLSDKAETIIKSIEQTNKKLEAG